MKKDLTTSAIDRQNILNNPEALTTIQEQLGITGMLYENEYRFTTAQIAEYFDVSTKTIKRHLDTHREELDNNGYVVLKGQKLKEFKTMFAHLLYSDIEDDDAQRDIDVPLSDTDANITKDADDRDINVPIIKQVSNSQLLRGLNKIGVFNFRALLNIGMLLTESERAKALRSTILDIVIDSLNQKLGGSAKYVNQRDGDFLVAITREPMYRKEFTSALSRYLDMGEEKYKEFTDEIYKVIFHENAAEYKAILKLEAKANARDTMYAEVLKLIASFEIGIADEMKDKSTAIGRPLIPEELKELIKVFASKRHWMPQLEDARIKMASRDYALRDVIHERLKPYIQSLSPDDYQRFIGDKSQDLLRRVLENPELLEVFKRLKDR
nr:HTH domain-containing protein [uncultured Emticicia sp.]